MTTPEIDRQWRFLVAAVFAALLAAVVAVAMVPTKSPLVELGDDPAMQSARR